MDSGTIVLAVVSLILGALFGWLIGRFFYRRSSEDLEDAAESLRKESAELRHLINVLLIDLKDAGVTDTEFDRTGRPIRFNRLRGTSTSVTSGAAVLTNEPSNLNTDRKGPS